MSICLIKIFYFEEKFDLFKITDGIDYEQISAFVEPTKVKDFQDIKYNIYYTVGTEYALQFIVYFNNKMYMHTRMAPIVFRRQLDMTPNNIVMELYALTLASICSLQSIFIANKRNTNRKMNIVLIFTIYFDLDISEEEKNVRIIKLDNENKIYERIYEFDFVKKFI